MAEQKKHKKIVKVVDIVRVNSPKKEAKIHEEQERESNSIRELEELVASKNKGSKLDKEFGSDKEKEKIGKPKRKSRRAVYTAIAIAAVVLFGYGAMIIMPRAEIHIVTKKVDWNYDKAVIVNKNITQPDSSSLQVPGEIIIDQKNTSMNFTPSGQKTTTKASGSVTIYNAYSTASQKLVATTRLQAPNGKIYRITDAVTVPGATLVGGKLNPSSVTALAVADQEGDSYVSGPITKMTIPGFQGTPRYSGFYASAPGGFKTGSITYVTSDDISKAKDQIQKSLGDSMSALLLTEVPDGYTLRPDSIVATTTKITVNPSIDAGGQFSVVAEGKVSGMVFKESDVLQLMGQLAQDANVIPDGYTELSHTISYDQPTVDWKLGKMTLPIHYAVVYSHPIDANELAKAVAGKSEVDLKSYVLSLPGIDKLSVAFWPFWVNSVTGNVGKIAITIE